MALARTLFVSGSFVASTIVAYGLGVATAPLPADAQANCPIDTVLYEQVSQLQTRALQLENLWQQRSTVTAPFRVVEDNGAELAWIGRGNSGHPEMRIGNGIALTYDEGDPLVHVFNGARNAGITVVDRAALFATADGRNGFYAESSPQGYHVASIQSGGHEVANFGVLPGRNAAVRFMNGAETVAALGVTAGGTGQLFAGNGGSRGGVQLGGENEDGGYVTVFQGDKPAVTMNTRTGSGAVAAFSNTGSTVAYLAARHGGGGIVAINDASENEVFHATAEGGEGIACVRQQNGNEYCLRPTLPLSMSCQ